MKTDPEPIEEAEVRDELNLMHVIYRVHRIAGSPGAASVNWADAPSLWEFGDGIRLTTRDGQTFVDGDGRVFRRTD